LQRVQPAGWTYPTGAYQQFCGLLRRELLAATRNPFDVAGRWATAAVIRFTAVISGDTAAL
jgi:hypothetical protein